MKFRKRFNDHTRWPDGLCAAPQSSREAPSVLRGPGPWAIVRREAVSV